MMALPLCFCISARIFDSGHAGAVEGDRRGLGGRFRRPLLQLLPDAAQPLLHLGGHVLVGLRQQVQDLRPKGEEFLFRGRADGQRGGIEFSDQRVDLRLEGVRRGAVCRQRLAGQHRPDQHQGSNHGFLLPGIRGGPVPGERDRPLSLLYLFFRTPHGAGMGGTVAGCLLGFLEGFGNSSLGFTNGTAIAEHCGGVSEEGIRRRNCGAGTEKRRQDRGRQRRGEMNLRGLYNTIGNS